MSRPPSSPPPGSVPDFGYMPGPTKAAVVLMWVLFGFGACGTVVLSVIVMARFDANAVDLDLARVPPAVWIAMAVSVGQMIVWTVL